MDLMEYSAGIFLNPKNTAQRILPQDKNSRYLAKPGTGTTQPVLEGNTLGKAKVTEPFQNDSFFN